MVLIVEAKHAFEAEEIWGETLIPEMKETYPFKNATIEEIISYHNDCFNRFGSNKHTGLPKLWDDETEERKRDLIESYRDRRVYIETGNMKVAYKFFKGYWVSNDKWAKLYSKDNVYRL